MTVVRTILFGLLAAAVPFAFGWMAGRAYQGPGADRVLVRVDTVYYERPTAVAASVRTVTVSVPRMLFAGEHVKDSGKSFTYDSANDKETAEVVACSATTPYGEQCANNAQCSGSCPEIPNNSADSVSLTLEIETRTYEDSLYRAQVSGPAIGGYRPTLDWVQVCDRTIVQTVTRRNRFAVTAGVGAAYTPKGFQPTLGVQVGVVLWGW